MERQYADWASLPLRLVLGFGFLYHGFPKLFSSQGHAMFTGMLQGIGVPAAGLMSWVVGVVEVLGGLALIAGAFVAVVSLLGIVDMLVAMFTVHLPNGFNFMNMTGMGPDGPTFGMPGYEINLLYIAGFVALTLAGAGAFSVDSLLAAKRAGPLSG
jgi:putative oxidoreductase